MTQGIHHIGITVGDLARSFDFYTAFGGEPEGGGHYHGSGLAALAGAAETELDVRMVRIGATLLELMQYQQTPFGAFDPSPTAVGVGHICLEVDDIDAALAALVARGGSTSQAPREIAQGSFAGWRVVYLRDPDGLFVELLQMPAS
jgi:catechol 2,3-dioxygenase-like lactoylglutathione lyase family enzyme